MKKILAGIITFLMAFCAISHADEMDDFAQSQQLLQKKLSMRGMSGLGIGNNQSLKSAQEEIAEWTEKLKKPFESTARGLSSPAYYFVSFSMPHLILKQVIEQANKYSIPVIVRGLVNNSFHETASRMFELTKNKNKGGVLLDPRLFDQYNIHSVPVLVVTDGVNEDKVSGSIPLPEALEMVENKGDASKKAKEILGRVSE